MKLFKLVIVVTLAAFSISAQDTLPIIKSNINKLSIQDGEVLKKDGWKLSPDTKPDIYETGLLNGTPKQVTFITDVDSISFNVEEGEKIRLYRSKGRHSLLYLTYWEKDFYLGRKRFLGESGF